MTDRALQQEAQALVRRARAGDQNAMALIQQIGVAARRGVSRKARAAYTAIKHYIDTHPVGKAKRFGIFAFGSEPAVIPELPAADPELSKPPMPKGALDGLFDPERFEVCVVRACKYRHGLPAAALVLAAGPPLVAPIVRGIGESIFGDDEQRSEIFFHGVQFCGDDERKKLASSLDAAGRRSLVTGQCVGRAARIQAVRQPGSLIGRYSAVAGWEFGE